MIENQATGNKLISDVAYIILIIQKIVLIFSVTFIELTKLASVSPNIKQDYSFTIHSKITTIVLNNLLTMSKHFINRMFWGRMYITS